MNYKEFVEHLPRIHEAGGWIPPEDMMKDIDFVIDDNLSHEELSDVRRPRYRCRGKSITREQAMQILKDTDHSIMDIVHSVRKDIQIPFAGTEISNGWFSGCSQQYGWIRANGQIGIDISSGIKYPELDELVYPYVSLYNKYSFLDMIWVYSNWNERPAKYWSLLCEYLDISDTLGNEKRNPTEEEQKILDEYDVFEHAYEHTGFEEDILLGIWMHNGKFELLNAERAKEVYKMYNELYACENTASYSDAYPNYEDADCDYITTDVFKELLSMWGLTPEEVDKGLERALSNERIHFADKEGKCTCG